MHDIVRTMPWTGRNPTRNELLLKREWLVTNGLGGYAAGTVGGALTRRYHGMLIAAYPAPLGRVLVFNKLTELLRFEDGTKVILGGEERGDGTVDLQGADHLVSFTLEEGLPVWRYEINGTVLEKRILLVHLQNTVHITYRLLQGGGVRLKLQPALHFRPHEAPVNEERGEPYILSAVENRYQVSAGRRMPALRFVLHGERGTFTLEEKHIPDIFYRIEYNRGYESNGNLWSPGYFAMDLSEGQDATLIGSTEKWETINAIDPDRAMKSERERRRLLLAAADPRARSGVAAELVMAADQFIITPAGRLEDSVRAHAMGDEIRTVIAGYHWFTDWGRDTMISLEGLTLSTGRHNEAGWILRTFAHYVRDGLIPNMFPEGKNEGLYHTADATLWFFHAVDRYVEATGDRTTLALIMPRLIEIVERHIEGTRFNIGIDPADGLLRQGAEGYQLTWMDAKVGDWVVTPRRGKAVEINALWYNALRLMERWCSEEGDEQRASHLAARAGVVYRSFNERFWYEDGGHLYDVVDGEEGDDPACRPNQVFSISLRYPVLDPSRWKTILTLVRERLLTPVGLRSLAPGHPDYKANYFGDLRSRDAAYHQGTVWPWLIGPFVDAWLRVFPEDRKGARRFLEPLTSELNEKCIGSINEVHDAQDPYSPRGCVAQAWSVAELLRCWLKTEG
ncbi:amylo-alpha-1,6-glucosidase [Geobacter sp. DSM 9736]|uniref:amylo-alpha-1,6-glucosidase n=1 Tax=Geobacter sp. DSM 9736 TaxID=1277350 RepID=UPI000B503C56|nr:amylo-alpha-1,6-glucosidase [Geobacter sp. DSM 9736]SNB46864.1 glycogen debranching enzyme, putative [Geobacter sp. DSM 9736]